MSSTPESLHFGRTTPGNKRIALLALICGVIGAILSSPVNLFVVEKWNLTMQDHLMRNLPAAEAHPDLVFLTLDEGSFNLSHLEPEEISASSALQLMERDFPWSRQVYAELFERILSAGARLVLVDIHFALPGKGDKALAVVVERHPDQIVFGSVLDLREEIDGSYSVVHTPPTATIRPGDGELHSGFVNFWPDRDGVVRTADYRTTPSLVKHSAALPGETEYFSLSAQALRLLGKESAIPDKGAHMLRFTHPGSFPAYPLWQVFVPDFWEKNLKNGSVFEGKIVLLGATAARFKDVFNTALRADLPGPELHLNALSAALQGEMYRYAPWWGGVLACLAGAAAVAVVFQRKLRPLNSLGAVAGLLVFYAGIFALLAVWIGEILPLMQPLGVIAMTGLLGFAMDFTEERRQRMKTRRTLERYVSREIVREVLDAPGDFLQELGGVRKELTVLFSDLRGFTALTESSNPVELVAQLNEYLSGMVEIVFRRQGTIDKFIGDAVMAVWGSVGSAGPAEDAARAVQAGREMLMKLGELNTSWMRQGKTPLRMGIGLHSGEAIFGNIGSTQKMELTVIGDAVNLASRIEGLCKQYELPLLFSGAVWEKLPSDPGSFPVDLVRVIGRREPVEIFSHSSALGIAQDDSFPVTFAGCVRAYRERNFVGALEFLEGLAPSSKEIFLVKEYHRRCRKLLETPPGPAWSPVVDLTSK